ncbi:MAG: hypothetical protein ACU85E_04825 [Gammaproteobacteria bacterium]
MLEKRKDALKVALLGMDGRTQKTLAMYLQGPCKSASVTVVNDHEADVNIIDADLPQGRVLLEKLLNKESLCPLIVLSLNDIEHDKVLFLKKPIKTEAMLAVLAQAKGMSHKNSGSDHGKVRTQPSETIGTNEQRSTTVTRDDSEEDLSISPPLKHFVADFSERDKTSKHRTAMLMDEKGFTALMSGLKPIDIGNKQQLLEASYDPKDYFQGYVHSAFKIANTRGQVLQLNSSWKQLLIFPHSKEIWLDSDDKQLRAFAGIAINKKGNQKMSISPLNPKMASGGALDKFQTMDAMLWKLACWTSKGRYPVQLDIERPVYLKYWPNFTRLLVTPNAMRIAALLIDKPRSPVNIINVLNIKPEHVFMFISAASAIGLLGQATRNADSEVTPPELKPAKKQGVLRRIINKLRAN